MEQIGITFIKTLNLRILLLLPQVYFVGQGKEIRTVDAQQITKYFVAIKKISF